MEEQKAPERIYHVSQSQFSISRYYGGCVFNGQPYTYIPSGDMLVRNDIFNADEELKKQLAKEERKRLGEVRAYEKSKQKELF